MPTFEHTESIARAADEVWSYAADIDRHPDWMTVANATVLSGDGTRVGTRGRERLLLGPFKWDVEFEVVEAVPGRRLVWRAVDDPRMDLEVGLDLEAVAPSAARATYRSTVQLRGLWRLLMPLVAMEGASGVRRELTRLKANLEGGSAANPSD